ncbi:type I restriction-modification system subunit M [Legionella pneumophila]|uniref:type I restriction-modification system subunit M n=1 Tax=Legionella pneumophila TaxID=446 RepID=UPI000486FE95|nr:class I SAM-dependent DNA methyltransferase [Legionella pneumophila]MCZ4757801.1 class I SAM-dependent DNA methyltransferase [Legionella pneumophila]MDW8863583.1 class I SAM-dependent DNA methyltransferase [Legionella pneumophila]MDW8888270.1 class I SAM-dependent DNA methyltransferase [Legionella pneumophila]MDW9013394.1 class I SAM-dependent DNA methyltransferase [Legionella pneumophila]CZO89201.1 Probable type I restriction enzyme BthVORF4518P M protein [Legionella pneumophila]
MNDSMHNTIINFIWGIADDVLRDVYVRGKYRDVILPMTVIRRLDALLEPTKEHVLTMKKQLDEAGIANQDAALSQASGEAFYNSSPFTLRDLRNRSKIQQLKADFEAYLDGFSSNVQEILDKFKFRNQIATLVEADILGALIEKFLNPNINLSPKPVYDSEGQERITGLDNHSMGTVFEELIRRFNEENNEEAGEHFTPRDVVKLMADVIFLPIAHEIESGTYLVYDGACGTGGMLTVAEERLQELAKEVGKEVSIHLYGQEIQPETYAIAKADLLLKGEGAEAENIKYGSTLSADAFISNQFDFMLSNPPYGKSWKTDQERMGGKNNIKDPRFVLSYASDPEYKMITRSSDGQLMFLVNKLTKMKESSKLGSRIAHVHNGSSLFTGDAGQGESNIRRWIIENDWLEAIIALPDNIFYNTPIATYIWVLTNRKTKERKGKVQLIDASNWYEPLRKNMGDKNCMLTDEHIQQICNLIVNPVETEQSKIFPNETFGYYKITVERPLRLSIQLTEKALNKFKQKCLDVKETDLFAIIEVLAKRLGEGPHKNYNDFINELKSEAKTMSVKLSAKSIKLLRDTLTFVDDEAEPVIKKINLLSSIHPDPLNGFFETNINGKPVVVEYETDTNLRDSEQVPLLEEGGIAAFFEREVLPYTSDAWIDSSKTTIGYEISFTKHFYKPIPMRTLEEIKADIYALENETEGLLGEIIGEVTS